MRFKKVLQGNIENMKEWKNTSRERLTTKHR